MFNFKKPKLFSLVVLSTVAFSACGAAPNELDPDAQLSDALPEDIQMVMTIDYTSEDQRAMFQDLISRFPETGLRDLMIQSYDSEAGEDLNYATTIEPIVSAPWQLMVGMSIAGEISTFEELESMSNDEVEIYVAGQFQSADQFEDLVELWMLDFEDNERIEEENRTLWTVPSEDIYMVRSGEFFVLTNSADYRDGAWDRLASNDGFEVPEDLKGDQDSIFSFYLPSGGLMDAIADIYTQMGATGIVQSLEAVGDMYAEFHVEENAFVGTSRMNIAEDNEMIASYRDYEVNLVEKVPGEGMMFYGEYSSLKTLSDVMISSFLVGFQTGLNGMPPADFDAEAETDKILNGFATSLGVEREQLDEFLAGPFAFAFYDVDSLYPGMVLFLDVEGRTEVADSMIEMVDATMDQLLVQLEAMVVGQGVVEEGFLQKDMQLVQGNSLRRIYLDWSKVNPTVLAELDAAAGIKLEEYPLEFYYGVTGDDMLVMALYPNFAADYGQNTFADSAKYQDAVDELGDYFGASLGYADFDELADLIERYFDIAVGTGSVSASDQAILDTVIGFMRTFDYMISSVRVEGDVMESKALFMVD